MGPAPEFWDLLYCLLRQIFPGKQDSSPPAPEKINLADRVTYVKSVFQIQGYGRPEFYHLPNDGEEGSREILLAFSWLLHRVKILEILLEKKRLKVGDHITICLCPYDVSVQKCEHSSSPTKQELDVRFLQWMNGRLRFCWRTLHAARLEESAILYKIHSYTQGCHVDKNAGHLSVMETDLVRRPKSCAKLLQAMESEISCLEAYMEWKYVESVYWQWMDTVLESACEDEHIFSQDMRTVRITSSLPPPYMPADIKVLSKCLRDTQDQLHKLTAPRNPSSQEQIKEMETELGEKELKRIKQEVRKKMEHCKPRRVDASDIHGSYRLLLREQKLHKSVNKDCSASEVHVTEVTKCLQSSIRKMEAEYYRLQEQCRERLDDMAEELEGIICIPPAKG
ncbi:tubulin epsilon and delta complex protein 1 isoform X2 [Dendropsophus ebraccatus]|uniref:tubulin epsilon and delta complex protein 1 isoform X2 n=1 Tax=Dendropsophus ebraccatus TaxID=150705 RepID=UPI00383172A0